MVTAAWQWAFQVIPAILSLQPTTASPLPLALLFKDTQGKGNEGFLGFVSLACALFHP